MRILHTSDWHLGISLHGLSLLEEQEHMVDQLLQVVREKQVDALILAGDVYDHSVARTDAVNLYNRAVTALCMDCKIPVFICAGNHDGAARLAACNQLLAASGLYVAGKISRELKPILYGDAAIHLLPYFNIDEVRALYPEETISTYADAMAVMADQLRQNLAEGKKNILVSHCFVTGGETSESDRAAVVGTATAVPASVFAGFDYVALGHLHRAQDPAPMVRYCGTPIKYSFSEAKQEKTFTILDTDTMMTELVPCTPIHELRVLEGPYEELYQQAAAEDPVRAQDYLKIQLTDCLSSIDKLTAFRNYYPNLLLLSGKSPEQNGENSITAEELRSLSPEDLIRHFCQDILAQEPDEELMDWFSKAEEATKEPVL